MKIFENWDLFLKFSQFFGYKWEFLANFVISEKIEKIETFISENLKIFGYDLNILIWTPPYIQEENIEIPDGTTIYEPENLNYQEVWFNNKFSFTQHIDILTCKIGQILWTPWKRHHLNIEAKNDMQRTCRGTFKLRYCHVGPCICQ